MFQSYALFPHMTVFENVAYGLRAEHRPEAEIQTRVAQVLAMVQMSELAGRKPDQLSGGQQQRVAIARAVVKGPRVLLLDEPLSALDYKLRKQMQNELKRLQRELGITFVFVTHDQEEALSMSDRVVVMREGVIEQVGTPRDVYEAPANLFVARFVGEINVFTARVLETVDTERVIGEVEGERHELRTHGKRFAAGATHPCAAASGGSAPVARRCAARFARPGDRTQLQGHDPGIADPPRCRPGTARQRILRRRRSGFRLPARRARARDLGAELGNPAAR